MWPSLNRVLAGSLVAMVVAVGALIADQYLLRQRIQAEIDRSHLYTVTRMLRRSSDELTRLARGYVRTADTRYRRYFWQVVAIRDGEAPLPVHYDRPYWDFLLAPGGAAPHPSGVPRSILARAHARGVDAVAEAGLVRAKALSDRLIEECERPAFALVDQARAIADWDARGSLLAQASDLVFGSHYHQRKGEIMAEIEGLFALADERATRRVEQIERWQQSSRWALFGALAVAALAGYRLIRRQRAQLQLSGRRRRRAAAGRALAVRQADAMRAERRHQSLASIGSLVGTVAHELRNPMAAIRNAHALLRASRLEPALAERALMRIDSALSRCELLLDDLFHFNRDRAPQPEPVALAGWLAEIAQSQLPAVLGEAELAHELEEVGAVAIDRELMLRALLNLVRNAVQAARAARPAGGARVVLRMRATADEVLISVIDNGGGVDEDTQQRMFEPLYTTKANGMGLGLAVVERVAEGHGGAVRLSHPAAGGLAVSIALPHRAAGAC